MELADHEMEDYRTPLPRQVLNSPSISAVHAICKSTTKRARDRCRLCDSFDVNAIGMELHTRDPKMGKPGDNGRRECIHDSIPRLVLGENAVSMLSAATKLAGEPRTFDPVVNTAELSTTGSSIVRLVFLGVF